jgi:hypothetical protein
MNSATINTTGAIVAIGAITCGGATVNGNLTTGTGNITGGILFINGIGVNGNNTNVLGNINLGTGNLNCGVMISNSISSGAITCTTINTQNSTINTGTGDITTRNVLGNGADFSRLQATELNIYNTLTSGTFGTLHASISNAGLLTCKGINAGSSLIQTTGNINCALIDVASTVYCRYLAVRDVGNTFDIIKLNQNGTIDCNIVKTTFVQCPFYESNPTDSGSIDIGIFNTSGNINIAQNNLTGNINIGNGGLIGVTQKLNIKRPMTIQYLPSVDYNVLGGSPATTIFDTYVSVPSTNVKTIGTITGVPTGIYLIFYTFVYRIQTSNITFSKQEYGLSSVLDSFNSPSFGDNYDLETTSMTIPAGGGTPRRIITKTATIIIASTSTNVRLTFGATYTTVSGGTVELGGSMRLVRIG